MENKTEAVVAWKLMPPEATQLMAAMARAKCCHPDDVLDMDMQLAYRAMFDASPAAPIDQPKQWSEFRECRHCGFECRPNSAESKKGYPLAQDAIVAAEASASSEAIRATARNDALEEAAKAFLDCDGYTDQFKNEACAFVRALQTPVANTAVQLGKPDAGFRTVPIQPTSDMLNAAVPAWHTWKARDNGGSVQELGMLIYSHMVDAAPLLAVEDKPK